MKHTLFCFLFVLVSVFADAKNPDLRPAYVVDSDKVDTSLSPGQCVIEIQFFRNDTMPVRETIKMSYNGKESVASPDFRVIARLPMKPGKYRFMFSYNAMYFEVVTDSIALKSRHRMRIGVEFTSAEAPVYTFKPVIYCYPQKTTALDVKLNVKGKLDFTYPQYNNGWVFTADPNGTIYANGKQYDYLFWDGQVTVNAADPKMREGFIVKKDSLIPFFENKLAAMGLSPREMQDFITFWCPLMAVNETNFVHFEFTKGYDQFAEIAITPKPDNLFRMFMVWSACDGTATVKPQQIEKANRRGFTVIEWGGAEAPELFNHFTTTN
jgi:hypothetical protein